MVADKVPMPDSASVVYEFISKVGMLTSSSYICCVMLLE